MRPYGDRSKTLIAHQQRLPLGCGRLGFRSPFQIFHSLHFHKEFESTNLSEKVAAGYLRYLPVLQDRKFSRSVPKSGGDKV